MALNGNPDETNGYNSVIKNGTLANANLVKSVIVPIGSIISWAKSLGGHTPSLPDGWVECDGSVLSDSDSPYNGDTLPNLTGSFLRGNTTSGTTGGADTHTHQQYIDGESSGTATGGPYNGHSHGAGNSFDMQIATSNNIPVYYEVVFIIRVK